MLTGLIGRLEVDSQTEFRPQNKYNVYVVSLMIWCDRFYAQKKPTTVAPPRKWFRWSLFSRQWEDYYYYYQSGSWPHHGRDVLRLAPSLAP